MYFYNFKGVHWAVLSKYSSISFIGINSPKRNGTFHDLQKWEKYHKVRKIGIQTADGISIRNWNITRIEGILGWIDAKFYQHYLTELHWIGRILEYFSNELLCLIKVQRWNSSSLTAWAKYLYLYPKRWSIISWWTIWTP